VGGVIELILTAVLGLITGHALPWLVTPGVYGLLGISLGLLRPRLLRRRVERSLRLNA
jgi:hypothetical protein